ncbi:MAG: homocysteine S-methyltransferase family protein [Planctomycetota bacterium]
MHELIAKLVSEAPVLTDGAWGTQLQARGLGPGECPDAWNLTHPERVAEVARAYVEAGSRVILTNTFGANRFVLARHGLEKKTAEINRAGVEISCRAAKSYGPTMVISPHATVARPFVFASLGPSGKMLVAGEVTEEELFAAFLEQVRALKTGGADAIVAESMSEPAEAAIAVRAVREVGLPAVASMVFDSGKDKDRTMTGATPERVAEELEGAGADVIGANCGHGIETHVPVCARLHTATRLPIWMKPNAGLPELEDGKTVYKVTALEFAAQAPALIKAGACFIGGCCGSTPEFIRALKKLTSASGA